MNQPLCRCCAALLLFVALGHQAVDASEPDKKFIELGWDIPSTAELRQQWRDMEQTTPFDGVMFRVETQDDQGARLSSQAIWDAKPWKRDWLKPASLGSVKPQGWLKDQLTIQANGLTGHLDEFWPSLVKTGWKGGDGESWERGPYYLDGLVPLAYLLDDPRLMAKTKPWIEGILASGQPDGWFGPAKNRDRWPLAVALKVITQYHEATGDPRALKLVNNYFAYLHKAPPDWPNKDWRGVRAMENAVTAWCRERRDDRGDDELSVRRDDSVQGDHRGARRVLAAPARAKLGRGGNADRRRGVRARQAGAIPGRQASLALRRVGRDRQRLCHRRLPADRRHVARARRRGPHRLGRIPDPSEVAAGVFPGHQADAGDQVRPASRR